MKLSFYSLIAASFITATWFASPKVLLAQTTPITIAAQGKSDYSIVIPQNAATSLKNAALEFQRCVNISTKAILPIVPDDTKITGNFFSFGVTKQAQAAGVLQTQNSLDGFSILTRGNNIYIWGVDTLDGDFTENGGTSSGTANGIYTFLEDYLGVCWLMPGDLGQDIPAKSTFTLNEITRTEKPYFINRRIPYIQNQVWRSAYKPIVKVWEDHMRLGYSFRLNNYHNWMKTITPKFYKEHPDWFAMIDGKRQAPVGFYKIETTNPEVVNYFAEEAIATLKANPHFNTYSLSPSDNQGWSESPQSKALYDSKHYGYPSVTPLIVKFYHDVAAVVAKKDPHAKLAGFIYWDHVYPPSKGATTLPKNFYPVVAPEFTYGYTLYRKDMQEELKTVLSFWSKATEPGHLFYSDLPNWLSQNAGLITPAAPEILNDLFSRLVENNVQGVSLYGQEAWSQGAMSNYILAEMMWNPHLDAHQLQREWLKRAYGDAAGAKMELLYEQLDKWFSEYYNQNHWAKYTLNEHMFANIYAAHFPELENLFLQAANQSMTPVQSQRLQLVRENLIVLGWRLKNAHLLGASFKSALPHSDAEIVSILEASHPLLTRFPGILPDEDEVSLSSLRYAKVQLSNASFSDGDASTLPNKSTYLIYAARDGKISILPKSVKHNMWTTTYLIKKRSEPNSAFLSGVLLQGRPIEFEAKAGQEYYLYIKPHKNMEYEIQIPGAVSTNSTFDAASGMLLLENKDVPIYVYGNAKSLIADPEGTIITTASAWEVFKRKYQNAQVIPLTTQWRFMPKESNKLASDAGFDDSSWKIIDGGSAWQRQGFATYYGKAWYRKTFNAPNLLPGQKAILYFSAVDGNAEVFINGKRVGSHLLGEKYAGWDTPFFFDVTDLLQTSENVVAVQVTSKSLDTVSGITGGVNLLIGKQ